MTSHVHAVPEIDVVQVIRDDRSSRKPTSRNVILRKFFFLILNKVIL